MQIQPNNHSIDPISPSLLLKQTNPRTSMILRTKLTKNQCNNPSHSFITHLTTPSNPHQLSSITMKSKKNTSQSMIKQNIRIINSSTSLKPNKNQMLNQASSNPTAKSMSHPKTTRNFPQASTPKASKAISRINTPTLTSTS